MTPLCAAATSSPASASQFAAEAIGTDRQPPPCSPRLRWRLPAAMPLVAAPGVPIEVREDHLHEDLGQQGGGVVGSDLGAGDFLGLTGHIVWHRGEHLF